MTERRRIASLAAPAAMFAVTALGWASGCETRRPRHGTEASRTLRFITTGPGTSVHVLARALAHDLRNAGGTIELDVLESRGSIRAVEAVESGEASCGTTFADAAYLAFVGRSMTQPSHRLRGVAVLQSNAIHFVVPAGSKIRTVADLVDRRIGIGAVGSGTATTAMLLLRAFGISPAQVQVVSAPLRETARQLVNGELDAILATANYPYDPVDFATKAGARLLPIEGPAVDKIQDAYPFFDVTSIPARTYVAQTIPIHTIATDSLLICRSDVDEGTVYTLTAQLFTTLSETSTSSLQRIDFAHADATPIPLHDGAARYYRERELLR